MKAGVGRPGGWAFDKGVAFTFRPFDREEMRVKVCERFTTELSLSPEQQKQMDPLVRQGMEEFENAHREQKARLRELMEKGRERMAAILTPEQRVKFEAMEQERENRMQSRSKGLGEPPPSPGRH